MIDQIGKSIIINKFINLILVITLLTGVSLTGCNIRRSRQNMNAYTPDHVNGAPPIKLPEPDQKGFMTLEETLSIRRSIRRFSDVPLTETEIGQLLWAAQGVTHPAGLRTAPSAGGLYPLEIFAATPDGFYHYMPGDHQIQRLFDYDPRPDLYQAAVQQDSVRQAPLVILITADFDRTAQKYGEERTPLYVHLEAGHAAQNILLQAVALQLGAVPIGAFYEDQLRQSLELPDELTPLYLIPVGHPE